MAGAQLAHFVVAHECAVHAWNRFTARYAVLFAGVSSIANIGVWPTPAEISETGVSAATFIKKSPAGAAGCTIAYAGVMV